MHRESFVSLRLLVCTLSLRVLSVSATTFFLCRITKFFCVVKVPLNYERCDHIQYIHYTHSHSHFSGENSLFGCSDPKRLQCHCMHLLKPLWARGMPHLIDLTIIFSMDLDIIGIGIEWYWTFWPNCSFYKIWCWWHDVVIKVCVCFRSVFTRID